MLSTLGRQVRKGLPEVFQRNVGTFLRVGEVIKGFHRDPPLVAGALESAGNLIDIGGALSGAAQIGVVGMEVNAVRMILTDGMANTMGFGCHRFDIKMQSTGGMIYRPDKIPSLGAGGEKVGFHFGERLNRKSNPEIFNFPAYLFH